MSACTNCIALKLILSCEWKLWQPLLSLQFYQKSPWRNHGNKMWHQKTMTSKAAYTVIRIYWARWLGEGAWSAEPLDSVPYLHCWAVSLTWCESQWDPILIYSTGSLYVWMQKEKTKWMKMFLFIRPQIMHDGHFYASVTSNAYCWYL